MVQNGKIALKTTHIFLQIVELKFARTVLHSLSAETCNYNSNELLPDDSELNARMTLADFEFSLRTHPHYQEYLPHTIQTQFASMYVLLICCVLLTVCCTCRNLSMRDALCRKILVGISDVCVCVTQGLPLKVCGQCTHACQINLICSQNAIDAVLFLVFVIGELQNMLFVK